MFTIDRVTVEYQQPNGEMLQALSEVSLSIDSGEFVCFVGPSGCGKTTLLRALAGLIRPTSGTVAMDGAEIVGPGPDRAVVFQEPRLLPWASVLENASFGLELRKVAKKEREALGREMLHRVGLDGFDAHYPSQLSGGMQQRVGLARALCVDPTTLLMDEPFGSVDALTRQLLQEDLLTIWSESGKTVIFVTHSIDEAVLLADRIVVMRSRPGQIMQVIANTVPRPRAEEVRTTEAFRELSHEIWLLLRDTMRPTSSGVAVS